MTDPGEESRGFVRSVGAYGRRRLDLARARLSRWSLSGRRAIPALDLGWELFDRFRRNNGSVLVGHIAYRLFVWLAPLMLILAAGLGFATSRFDIVKYATEFGVATETAEDAAAQAEVSRVTALVVGVPALAMASWSLLRGLHYAYSQVWGIEIKARKGVVRLSLYVMVGAVALAMLFLMTSALQRQGPLLSFAGWAGSLMVTTAALWVLAWMMPRRTDRWIELLPGPVFGAIGLSLLHVFASVYLPGRVASASVLYGGIGIAIALLFYMFLMAYMLVLSPFLNAVWADRAEILAGRPWVIDPEAAPRWARKPLRRLTPRGEPQGESGEAG